MILVNPFTGQVLNSYFGECERDDEGRCLPRSSSKTPKSPFMKPKAPYPIEDRSPTPRDLKIGEVAIRTGKEMYDIPEAPDSYYGPDSPDEIERVSKWKLSDLVKSGAIVGTFQYAFDPFTGEGLELGDGKDWSSVVPEGVAKDGKIYTMVADDDQNELMVVEVDQPRPVIKSISRKLRKGLKIEERRANPLTRRAKKRR